MEELDRLFKRIYEDNVNGRISDERFEKLSAGYEVEQKDLQYKISAIQAELAEKEKKAIDVDSFLSTVRKYTDIQELTPTILNEFIERYLFMLLTETAENGRKRWKYATTVSAF